MKKKELIPTTTTNKHFNSIDDAKNFLNKNNIPIMTGAEMIKKMSDDQIIKFAEFLYWM